MNDDDELRRRLHEIPAPAARLDADAVLAGAKRRRRPKTIALSSAATVAGVLIFAPLVAPGLEALRPSSVSVDSGAAPEAAQESSSAGTDGGGGASGGGADAEAPSGAQSSETGAVEDAQLCGLPRAGELGLTLAFAGRPDGATPVQLGTIDGGEAQITAVAIDSLAIVDDTARVEAGAAREQLSLAAGETAVLTVVTATLEQGACGDGTPSAPSPVAIVGLDGAAPIAVIGSPWE